MITAVTTTVAHEATALQNLRLLNMAPPKADVLSRTTVEESPILVKAGGAVAN
ncbi:hypothetical protein [Nocardioides stalactiti]|uniref:hypothetical protein n=1 Tax=Nocardioides stalactiti TaxID=2755356 RepID=UPI001C815B90|nr:hypothetical protein [Nocardioides stalactiti]